MAQDKKGLYSDFDLVGFREYEEAFLVHNHPRDSHSLDDH